MLIREATAYDVTVIHKLAHAIWWPTYRHILGTGQISLMLENMYSEKALEKQLSDGITFLIAEKNTLPAGFAGYSLIDDKHMIFKIHKIYIHPSEQGKGTGRSFVEHIMDAASKQGGNILELNVNRNNPAFYFYKKLGFTVYQEIDIPYYQYVMNDYVMRKKL